MPLQPNLIGVNKLVLINGQYILAQTADRATSQEIQAKNYIQGTIKNRIMDIGGASEIISISAPILIGGGSYVDGRTLLTNQIANILNPSTMTLPLLQQATISLTKQAGTVNMTLMSDGNPSTEIFTVSPLTSTSLTDGTHTDVLNPTLFMATRVATFYDFRVCAAGFTYLVNDVTITVEVDIEKNYFLGGNDGSTTDDQPVPVPNPWNFGTPFPWLTPKGIRISGRGKAAVLLIDRNNDGVYEWAGNTTTGVTDVATSETYNVILGADISEIDFQSPGVTNTVNQPFSIEVYDGLTDTWVNLFRQSGASEDLFNLDYSLLEQYKFNVSADLLTADFEFKCYVV